jgi:hypothetical protein
MPTTAHHAPDAEGPARRARRTAVEPVTATVAPRRNPPPGRRWPSAAMTGSVRSSAIETGRCRSASSWRGCITIGTISNVCSSTSRGISEGMSERNAAKDPDEWVTGDEPMTGPQASYLETLAREAEEEVTEDLTKAEASKRIDKLQDKTGRGA